MHVPIEYVGRDLSDSARLNKSSPFTVVILIKKRCLTSFVPQQHISAVARYQPTIIIHDYSI